MSKLLNKIKNKLGDAKKNLKMKKDQYKLIWKSIEPTIKAKHIPLKLKKIKITNKDKKIIYQKKNVKCKMIKYRKRVGLYVATGKLPIVLEAARKTGDLRQLKSINKSIDYYPDYRVNYYLNFDGMREGVDGEFEFVDCDANLLFYKGLLVEVELPFSNTGEYVEGGLIKRDKRFS